MCRRKNQAVVHILAEFADNALFKLVKKGLDQTDQIKSEKTEFPPLAVDDQRFDIKIIIHPLIGTFIEIPRKTDSGWGREDFLCIADAEHLFSSPLLGEWHDNKKIPLI